MRGAALLSPRLLAHLILIRPFIRLVLGLAVSGREHLEGANRIILAANHNSHLDALLLMAALPLRLLRTTRPVAAADHFSRNRLAFKLAEWLVDPIWVDRRGPARRSVDGMAEWLEAGGSLIIFPEGTRGEPGRLERFKGGLGMVAARLPGVAVVPAWLTGPERSLPRSAAVPVPVWNSVILGPPRRYSGGRGEIVAALRRSIEELARQAPGSRPERPRKPPLTLAVLGIDGSGKSTLARSLARSLSRGTRTCQVGDRLELYEDGEPAEFQPLPSERIRRVVSRRAKRAASLRAYKAPKLAELLLRDHLLKEARSWYRPAFLVLDGSPLLNLLAWAALHRDRPLAAGECAAALRILTSGGASAPSRDPLYRRFPELSALAAAGLARFDLPDAVVFLDVDPEVAAGRIAARGEALQAHETPERLDRLRRGYRSVCGVLETELGLPCLRVEGSREPAEVLKRAVAFAGRPKGPVEGTGGAGPAEPGREGRPS